MAVVCSAFAQFYSKYLLGANKNAIEKCGEKMMLKSAFDHFEVFGYWLHAYIKMYIHTKSRVVLIVFLPYLILTLTVIFRCEFWHKVNDFWWPIVILVQTTHLEFGKSSFKRRVENVKNKFDVYFTVTIFFLILLLLLRQHKHI